MTVNYDVDGAMGSQCTNVMQSAVDHEGIEVGRDVIASTMTITNQGAATSVAVRGGSQLSQERTVDISCRMQDEQGGRGRPRQGLRDVLYSLDRRQSNNAFVERRGLPQNDDFSRSGLKNKKTI